MGYNGYTNNVALTRKRFRDLLKKEGTSFTLLMTILPFLP